jgi:hypothetical protein
MQNMLRMIGYGENLDSGFPLILSAWNEKHWLKPELIEQPELMQVKLVLHMDELNMFIHKRTDEQNIKPQKKFQGFSSIQMYYLVNKPFEEGCPIQLCKLNEKEIEEIPFLRQALYLMRLLEEKELRLTAQGYIPPKIVTELYKMGLEDWNSNYYKQKIEPRVETVQVLRIALKSCGFIKVRIGKMSLTTKGQKILCDVNAIFHALMRFMFWTFNVASFDIVPNQEVANIGGLFSLWLLHHYGDEWRNQNFYAEKYFEAFPQIGPSYIYGCRTFDRLFHYIGICEINDTENDRGVNFGGCTRKRDILDRIFSFTEPEL